MNLAKEKILNGQFMAGAWCSLGSASAAEMVGVCGYDWALLDAEHAPSSTTSLMAQMQGLSRFSTLPIVRIPWLDRVHIKWALDIGAKGIMVPYVETAEQAQEAVTYMQYPPKGVRGVGGAVRACDYGSNFVNYMENANKDLITIVQLETKLALENMESIAKVEDVDVLFVGPMDLSFNINMPERFNDPNFIDILKNVAICAKNAKKASGILVPDVNLVPICKELGYTFVAVSSDVSILMKGLKQIKANMC